MNVVTIIPARGNSKSIPKKNIKLFNGYPLIKYSIEYSLKSKLVNSTIVSTEDNEISLISKKYGAEVPFMRPKELSRDEIKDFDVLYHAMIELKKMQRNYEYFILLRPTSPLRPENLIEKSLKILEKNPKATSVRAVTKTNQHPYRQWKIVNQYLKNFVSDSEFDEPYNEPRQKLPSSYFQTGDIEVVRLSTLLNKSVSGNNILPIFIDSNSVFDIDTLEDFEKAQSSNLNV